jgi:hypothetical protein
MNAFSNEQPVSTLKLDPSAMATNIISLLLDTQLDGVSIDFEDFHSVIDGTASAWLLTLLSGLRKGLPSSLIVLQIHPTFLNKIALLKSATINSYVDLYVLKYHSMIKADYNTY